MGQGSLTVKVSHKLAVLLVEYKPINANNINTDFAKVYKKNLVPAEDRNHRADLYSDRFSIYLRSHNPNYDKNVLSRWAHKYSIWKLAVYLTNWLPVLNLHLASITGWMSNLVSNYWWALLPPDSIYFEISNCFLVLWSSQTTCLIICKKKRMQRATLYSANGERDLFPSQLPDPSTVLEASTRQYTNHSSLSDSNSRTINIRYWLSGCSSISI